MSNLNTFEKKSGFFTKICRRIIDYSLFFLLINSLNALLPGIFNMLGPVLESVVLVLLFIPIEAALLSIWGRTPGMVFCGITLRDRENNKLSFTQALKWSLFLNRDDKKVVLKQKKGRLVGILTSIVCMFGVLTTTEFGSKSIGLTHQQHQTVNNWVHYTSKEGGFSSDFPIKPGIEQKVLDVTSVKRKLNYEEFAAHPSADLSYAVSSIELPKKWGFIRSNTLLKNALTVLTDSTFEAKLTGSTFLSYMHYPALDFHIKEGSKEIQGRLILVGTKLYKLAVTYDEPNTDQDVQLHVNEFLNSFEYVKSGK